MASAKVYRMDGSEAGTVDLSEAVFGVEPNRQLIKEVVVALQANRRQGNAETKTRAEVSGGGIKPYRQKGTGGARHGSIREPIMRGGGTVWGPHKRSYRQDVPLAARRKALCMALSDRVRDEKLCVLDQLDCPAPKTKPVAAFTDALSVTGRGVLFITPEADRNFVLSSRNIPKVNVRSAHDVNALDVLQATKVIVVRGALNKLEERLS